MMGKFTTGKNWRDSDRVKTEYLLRREVGHVLAALTPRNRLIAQVCLHTGLRVGDVVSLKTSQIKRMFVVREAKTGKVRRVGLPDSLARQVLAQAGPEWAFPGSGKTGHQTRQAVWKDIKRAAKAFRLPQNVGPHSLRKVYAVELLAKYGDLQRVQRALNHSDQAVTLIYAMADRLLDAKYPQGVKSREKEVDRQGSYSTK